MKHSRALRPLVAAIVSLFVLGLTTEIAVRIWAPQELISDVIALGGPVCHRLEPGARGVQRSAEYKVDLRITEQGLRDRLHAVDTSGDAYRILLLGDSHAFGWGVAMEEAFPQALERLLNGLHGRTAFEVFNAGTMGYATGHQYQYLLGYGLDFAPDLVLVVVDLLHDVSLNNTRYAIVSGQPVRNDRACLFEGSRSITAWIPFAGTLRGHSQAFRFVGLQAVRAMHAIRKGAEPATEIEPDYDLTTTEAIFVAMRDELARRGIGMVVAVLPEFADADEHVLRSFEGFLDTEGIPFLSLTERLGADFYPSALTFRRSPHFNPAGHDVLAREIAEFLTREFTPSR